MKVGDKFTANGLEWTVDMLELSTDRVRAKATVKTAALGVFYYQTAWWTPAELLHYGAQYVSQEPQSLLRKYCQHDWRAYDTGFPGSQPKTVCFSCDEERA